MSTMAGLYLLLTYVGVIFAAYALGRLILKVVRNSTDFKLTSANNELSLEEYRHDYSRERQSGEKRVHHPKHIPERSPLLPRP